MSATTLTGGCCIVLLLLTTSIHYEALQGLNLVLPRLRAAGRARLLVVMLSVFVVHVAEVVVFAVAFYLLTRHAGVGTLGAPGPPSFKGSLYFSFETYASLGYSDVVPSGALRMLAGAEALNGLLLIGWSASYAHVAMDSFWRGGAPQWRVRRRKRRRTSRTRSAKGITRTR